MRCVISFANTWPGNYTSCAISKTYELQEPTQEVCATQKVSYICHSRVMCIYLSLARGICHKNGPNWAFIFKRSQLCQE